MRGERELGAYQEHQKVLDMARCMKLAGIPVEVIK
jgi:hypothetical protein